MRSQFDDGGNGPDVSEVIAEVTDAFRNNLKRFGPYIGIGLFVLAAAYGFYQVGPGERGVVRRFGREMVQVEPGLHFAIPFIDEVDKVNVEKIHRIEVGFRGEDEQIVKDEALMLTGDENIVAVQLVVQYRISDPSKFLFRLRDADNVLHTTSEVVLRTLVGRTNIDDVMTNRSLDAMATKSSQDQADAVAAGGASAWSGSWRGRLRRQGRSGRRRRRQSGRSELSGEGAGQADGRGIGPEG
jgi:regulator of protease activity HflC (stomatin/prohibitin superfamily)